MERLNEKCLQNAKWISVGEHCSTPLIRGVYHFPKIQKASITIAGLGCYEIFVNGKKITEDLFLPLNTDYNKRDKIIYGNQVFQEELSHRLYCPVYDITAFLMEGNNTVCFMMGPGWCEYKGWDSEADCSFGRIKLCYAIQYVDDAGTVHEVCSNDRLRWKPGFVKQADIMGRELHDYTEYDDDWMKTGYEDTDWLPVNVVEPVDTSLYVQDCPADRVMRHISPQLLYTKGDVSVYDAGELITGYPVLVSEGTQGGKISVRYGELLNEEGRLDEEHTFHQLTEFLTDGAERTLHSRFTWLCFRYFEVTGPAKVKDCLVIHSDIAVTSDFESDSEILNWIWKAYIRTELDNMHCGIPSDCPHAERRGYTGDGQLTCAAAMLQLDARKFFKKWIYDISDCQDKVTGHIQYTAPFLPSGGGPGGWGCAIVMVPYAYYKQYGDLDVLKDLQPQMLHWFNYMEEHSEKELVVSDLEGVWCLGDWCAPDMGFNELDKMRIPSPLVNTYFYIKAMQYVLEINGILHLQESNRDIQERIARKKEALIREYYNSDTGDFAGNLQGSNAYALDLGLGDERTLSNMVSYYQRIDRFDTGIFATDILIRILFEKGKGDLAIRLLTTKKSASYYEQMMSGATTLSEYWTGGRSRCHPMFGAVTKYFFEYILGIRQVEGSTRFDEIRIEPGCMDRISACRGFITTPNGKISVQYDKDSIRVSIPENIKGMIMVHDKEYLLKAGETIWKLQ